MTTHWPLLTTEAGPLSLNVWLQDGKQSVGADLRPGDLVLIYQTLDGPGVRQLLASGESRLVRRGRGKGGVVAIMSITGLLARDPEAVPEEYQDGRERLWNWTASLRLLSIGGFVERSAVAKALGYLPNYSFNGFGELKSGLKCLDEAAFDTIVRHYRDDFGERFPLGRVDLSGRGHGSGIESPEHLALKLRVAADPAGMLGEAGLACVKIEHPFGTGDCADLVLRDRLGRVIGCEIEVSVGEHETEGPLQALKYRHMLEFECGCAPGGGRAFLVAHSIHGLMRKRCEQHQIECFSVPLQS